MIYYNCGMMYIVLVLVMVVGTDYRVMSGNFGHQVNSERTMLDSFFDYWNKILN